MWQLASSLVYDFRFSILKNLIICLFHLYPLVTRKWRWRYILDEFAPA